MEPRDLLKEKMENEMDEFRHSYDNMDKRQIYNDWHIIGFKESFYELLSDIFEEKPLSDKILAWLSNQDKPLDFLYNKYQDSFDALNFDSSEELLGFIEDLYSNEKALNNIEKASSQLKDDYSSLKDNQIFTHRDVARLLERSDGKSLVIPNGIIQISGGAFSRCTSLESIKIPPSVKIIEDGAFYQCSSLKKISLPDDLQSLGKEVFQFCTNLKEIKIPNNITKIGDKSFYGCSSLKHVKIPEGVTTIGEYAFADCATLAKIKIPARVKAISQDAFRDCTSLESVTFSRNSELKYIDCRAFYECNALRCIDIPKSVTSIDESAFPRGTTVNCVNKKRSSLEDRVTDARQRFEAQGNLLDEIFRTSNKER